MCPHSTICVCSNHCTRVLAAAGAISPARHLTSALQDLLPALGIHTIYLLYLLYQYKSTNTDAEGALNLLPGVAYVPMGIAHLNSKLLYLLYYSTKVQILTQMAPGVAYVPMSIAHLNSKLMMPRKDYDTGAQFTCNLLCFAGTRVHQYKY